MLTGKAKEDFKKWYSYLVPTRPKTYIESIESLRLEAVKGFFALPFSMQYSVYVDWFDSVGIYIEENQFIDIENRLFGWKIMEKKESGAWWGVGDIYNEETRHEARTKAIEKACEIYNEKPT